jgi:tetratricopeptide (TPR) repeat protein
LSLNRNCIRAIPTGGPPPNAISYFGQGLAYEQVGEYNQAIDMFTRAVMIYPRYAEARREFEKASESLARQQ